MSTWAAVGIAVGIGSATGLGTFLFVRWRDRPSPLAREQRRALSAHARETIERLR